MRAGTPVDWERGGLEAAGSAGGTALTGLIGAVKNAGKLAEAQKEYTFGKRYNEVLKQYGLTPLGKDWSAEDSALEIANKIYSGRMTVEDVKKMFETAGGYDIATKAYMSEMPGWPGWTPGAAKDSAPARTGGERGLGAPPHASPAESAVPPPMSQTPAEQAPGEQAPMGQAPGGQALPGGGELQKALQAGTQRAAVSSRAIPMSGKIQQEEPIAAEEGTTAAPSAPSSGGGELLKALREAADAQAVPVPEGAQPEGAQEDAQREEPLSVHSFSALNSPDDLVEGALYSLGNNDTVYRFDGTYKNKHGSSLYDFTNTEYGVVETFSRQQIKGFTAYQRKQEKKLALEKKRNPPIKEAAALFMKAPGKQGAAARRLYNEAKDEALAAGMPEKDAQNFAREAVVKWGESNSKPDPTKNTETPKSPLGRGVYKFERAYKDEHGDSFYVFTDTESGERKTLDYIVSEHGLARKLEELEGMQEPEGSSPLPNMAKSDASANTGTDSSLNGSTSTPHNMAKSDASTNTDADSNTDAPAPQRGESIAAGAPAPVPAKTAQAPQTAPSGVHSAFEVKNPDSFTKGELYALGRGVYKFERAYKNERGHSFYVFTDTESGARETFSNAQLKEAVVSARKLERKQEAPENDEPTNDEPTLEELEGIEKETAGSPPPNMAKSDASTNTGVDSKPSNVHSAFEIKSPESLVKGELYALRYRVYRYEGPYKDERGRNYQTFTDIESGARESFSSLGFKNIVMTSRELERKQKTLENEEETGRQPEVIEPPKPAERAEQDGALTAPQAAGRDSETSEAREHKVPESLLEDIALSTRYLEDLKAQAAEARHDVFLNAEEREQMTLLYETQARRTQSRLEALLRTQENFKRYGSLFPSKKTAAPQDSAAVKKEAEKSLKAPGKRGSAARKVYVKAKDEAKAAGTPEKDAQNAAYNAVVESAGRQDPESQPKVSKPTEPAKNTIENTIADEQAFKRAYDELDSGNFYASIPALRKKLGWTTERFDTVMTRLRDKEALVLQAGDKAFYTEEDMRNTFTDENGFHRMTVMWRPNSPYDPFKAGTEAGTQLELLRAPGKEARTTNEAKQAEKAQESLKEDEEKRREKTQGPETRRSFEPEPPVREEGKPTAENPVTLADIRQTITKAVPWRHGQTKGNLGLFNRGAEVTRTQVRNDLMTELHEVGHFLDKKLGLREIDNPDIEQELFEAGSVTSGENAAEETIRAEGAAQFVLHYMANDKQAQTKFPEYYKAFTAALGENPEMKAFVDTLSQQTRSYLTHNPEERLRSSVVRGTDGAQRTLLEKAREAGDLVYTLAVDYLHPLRTITERVREKMGVEYLEDEYNLYGKARTAPGYKGRAGQDVTPFMDTLRALKPEDHTLLTSYLAAGRALDYREHGMYPGLDTAYEQELDTFNNAPPHIKEAAKKLRETYAGMVRKTLVKTGIMTEEQFDYQCQQLKHFMRGISCCNDT
jgi:hypothetical protein